MKLKYMLKKAVNLKTGYIIAIVLILMLVIGGYFSYAIFTASSEAKGALNIITGNLYSIIESSDLDDVKSISINPNETKIITLRLTNVNGRKTKVNLYYQTTSDKIDIGYLGEGDKAPDKAGYVLEKNGSDGDSKTIYVKMINNDETTNKITFGTSAGLENAELAFPTDKNNLNLIEGVLYNTNIVNAYTYDQENTETMCITGEEETCEKTTCYENKDENSCPAGTIIKYKVNDSEEKYFHVLHDDGATITLQQRENTIDNAAWYESSNDNSQGPTTILPILESATSSWSNVEDQTYTMGTTSFGSSDNAYTGCDYNTLSCETNTYTLDSRTAKARMITLQEATALGCTTTNQSCPNWMNNYLYNSTSYGGTVDDATDSTGATRYGYWTMSAISSSSDHAWHVSYSVGAYDGDATRTSNGARAVVVVNKK